MAQIKAFGRTLTLSLQSSTALMSPDPIKQASPESKLAKPRSGMISRPTEAAWIDKAWLEQLALNEDSILRKEGYVDLKLYDALLDDDMAFSGFQQRRLALVSRPWKVEPGDESPKAKEAADHLSKQLAEIGWDRICDLMMYGLWYGYAVGEALYKIGPDGKIWLDEIVVPDRRWFAFTNAGELRLRTPGDPNGQPVPDNKFWSWRTGATNDFNPYGQGIAHYCYWPVWFKRNVQQFWSVFLEKLGRPTVMVLVPQGADDETTQAYLAAAASVGRDQAVAIPREPDDNTADPLKPIESARTAGTGSAFKDFIEVMDEAITRITLGQTMTSRASASGIGSNQADVQKGVRDEIVKSDSDRFHESFNRSVARWLTAWNFGEDVAPPRVYRELEDEEDLNTVAERDVKLAGINIHRTEESIREVYGEGYEYREPEPDPLQTAKVAALTGKPMAPAGAAKQGALKFDVHDPQPLYIHRQLLNAKKVRDWAAKQGIGNLVPADKMHVTVLSTTNAVDWFGLPEDWWGDMDGKLTIQPGGPRKVERLGDKGGVVLHFVSRALKYRHGDLIEAGAVDKFPEYLTHVTLSYDAGEIDLEDIEPYTGALVFGPEIFEPVDDTWSDKYVKPLIEFSAEELDEIDQMTARLMEDSDPLFSAMATELQGALKGVKSPEGLRIALLQAFERLPVEKLAQLGGPALIAMRAGAEANAGV